MSVPGRVPEAPLAQSPAGPLLCPVCAAPFSITAAGSETSSAQAAASTSTLSAANDSRLRCNSGHTFDRARQGYLNLLTGKPSKFQGDTLTMAQHRARFLEAGHYQVLAQALADALAEHLPGSAEGSPTQLRLLEVATGTGYYLQQLTQALEASGHRVAAAGFDLSKFSLRRAARLNPGATVFAWDVWRDFPLPDDSIDAVLVVFAPRNIAEFARVLAPGGILVVVTPLPEHLQELVSHSLVLSVEEDKLERLDDSMAPDFKLLQRRQLRSVLSLCAADVADVALMGPAGHHADENSAAQIQAKVGPGPVKVTIGFTISLFTAA